MHASRNLQQTWCAGDLPLSLEQASKQLLKDNFVNLSLSHMQGLFRTFSRMHDTGCCGGDYHAAAGSSGSLS